MAALAENVLTPRDAQSPWTVAEAAHLLTRTQFGFALAELNRSVQDGLAATVDRLLSPQPESIEFQAAERALWETALATANSADLKIWWLYRLRFSANPLVEKMTLFWHNLFATSNAKVNHVGRMAQQHQRQRGQALGDFRELIHGMARDPAMLIWLDGNANRKRHPNENFAREVMELFSLGIGNYTERDILEAARAFTGWHVRDGEFWFNTLQHDAGVKTLFGTSGPFDGNDVLNLCLAQAACPRFLAFKLLRTFVTPEPTALQIDAVAASLRQHDWQLRPVLRDLLTSREFFEPVNRQAMIKSPLEFVLGALRALGGTVRWPAIVELLADLGQDVFEPPSVKGWDGGRLWINTSTVLLRTNFVTNLCFSEKFGKLALERAWTSPLEPNVVPQQCVDVLLGGGPADGTLTTELQSLWQQAAGPPEGKLRSFLATVMSLPEYQVH